MAETLDLEIVIENVVATATLGQKLNLLDIVKTFLNVRYQPKRYEPEQFPGLIYRMRDPKTVLLVFSSGKIVCTGGKCKENVYESVNKLYELLDDYALFYN